MKLPRSSLMLLAAAMFLLLFASNTAVSAQGFSRIFRSEQREIEIRDPSSLPRLRIPDLPAPPTVSSPRFDAPPQNITLDDAIRTALRHSEVVRVLAGATATASGRTIYDPAIANTAIDQQQGRFDPLISVDNSWNRVETPQAIFDPMDPTRAIITGIRSDGYNLRHGLKQTNELGGEINFGVNANPSRLRPGVFPLNPQSRSSIDLSYTQPLLQGGGFAANLTPIILARIDTERSYFQLKDSIQELVRSTIDAYWLLVFARTELWAREQQVKQAQFAYDRTQAKFKIGSADAGEMAQTRVALENFRATLIGSQANVLQREAAIRNLLGLPPYSPNRMIPVTQPSNNRLEVNWEEITNLAEQQRPDLIELKLILEADEQLLLQARNQALPRLDALALYRWNGLEGEMPIGTNLSSRTGEFADWTLAVNFSVPLGLRQARAQMRQRELIISRDRANLEQGLHSVVHTLALNVRNLDQNFRQYQAFQDTRAAAQINLKAQGSRWINGLTDYINYLQAIVSWGDAVISESRTLLQYNTGLATLERQTGTIMETHGVHFWEERYQSLGPLGRFQEEPCYPESIYSSPNDNRHGGGERPAEEFFELKDPTEGLKINPLPKIQPFRKNVPPQRQGFQRKSPAYRSVAR